MGKKRKVKAGAPAASANETPVVQPPSVAPIEGEIRLVVPRLNAHKVMCPAGTVIAPDVDGWPEARVGLHLRHGHAAAVATKPILQEGSEPAEESSEAGSAE